MLSTQLTQTPKQVSTTARLPETKEKFRPQHIYYPRQYCIASKGSVWRTTSRYGVHIKVQRTQHIEKSCYIFAAAADIRYLIVPCSHCPRKASVSMTSTWKPFLWVTQHHFWATCKRFGRRINTVTPPSRTSMRKSIWIRLRCTWPWVTAVHSRRGGSCRLRCRGCVLKGGSGMHSSGDASWLLVGWGINQSKIRKTELSTTCITGC